MLPKSMFRISRAAAVCAVAVLAAACGTSAPTASPTASRPPTSAPTSTPTVNETTPPTVAPTSAPATPAATPTSAPTSQPSDEPAAATVLLEVTQEGGFIAPSARLGNAPIVTVDTAGNIYTGDPNAAPMLIQPVV